MITESRLREVLRYDPNTGIFTWLKRISIRIKAGNQAGAQDMRGRGRILIRIDNRLYLAHRLAWLYMTGNNPPPLIDHINRDPSDNRWTNLRQATPSQNGANSRARGLSGVKGVSYSRERRKWAAQITKDRRLYPLGRFNTIEEAKAAYDRAARAMFGEYARAA